MSEKLGTVLYGSEHSADEVFLGRDFSSGKNYSEKTAAQIDDEIRGIIASCYKTCKKHLSDNIEKLHFVAEFLLKNESMDEEQFKAAMEAENPTIEFIESIATEKKRKSDEENRTAHESNAKAEEEARRMAEEEAARKRAEISETGKFPADEFFNTVFNIPVDIDTENEDGEAENSSENENKEDDGSSETKE
jgi:hypothetical protein